MTLINIAKLAVAGALVGSAVGLAAGVATADPWGNPDPVAPANAPRKPADTFLNEPVVWWWGPSGGHWGVWINGQFLTLT
ncbi:MAG: hypothetical protein U0R77_07725 [Mycolicibacterium insubricum]|jgi:Spy/CpxP family protein refolding chaperone|uniref:Uncharacterized protein n=1 Tax=Mycolicibacterium insubricum TaxID=444597 RepID=A0A1X0DDD0_9MYCO|nr:hypothetical protein [Mycolicibacterium insubricum]MCB0927487.1 hypothetical protein [Mycobacterium sp.]MCB9441642.1 hypothetical protein [Mycolicibacterium sp.]MCV7083978.1 hypothetical protein [Mycolicibacterium insubricum]ORA70358.1 hypothetical protein BST26_11005 [Mycolicibacterium insubricum]BBZ67243.1 hypothetical protein MINS_26720 [Mycolicibacterium insubricum]